MMRATANYLGTGLAALIGLIALAILANWFIDPYGLYSKESRKGVNERRTHPDRILADVKLTVVRERAPSALILGNSRAEIGLDPEHPVWAERGLNAYNLSLPGRGIETVRDQIHAVSNQMPKAIVLSADYLDFLVDPRQASSTLPAPASSQRTALETLNFGFTTLMSIQASIDSIETLRLQQDPERPSMTQKGFNPLREYQRIARVDGYALMFRQRAEENARRYARSPKGLFAQDGQSSLPWLALSDVLAQAGRSGSQVWIVIHPYHAQILALFEPLGMIEPFQAWKKELVARAERAAAEHGTQVEVWDFSGYGSHQCEAIPGKGDKRTAMRWYWEGGHYKKELGDLMLATALAKGPGVDQGSGGFGMRLRADTLAANDARIAAERQSCQAAQPGLFEEARQMAAKAGG